MEDEENDFISWLSQDPFFRLCSIVECLCWLLFFLFALFIFCLCWKFCFKGKRKLSLGSPEAFDTFELRRLASDDSKPVSLLNDNTYVAPLKNIPHRLWFKRLVMILTSSFFGFFFMVIGLAIAIPYLMPHFLFVPEDCDGHWCQFVPGSINKIVNTTSGNTISIRYFPANVSGTFYEKNISLMYSNPNAGYTTRSPYVYHKLSYYGISVYAWDYPGYMLSSGSPTFESVMEAARAVLAFISRDSNRPEDNIVLLGRSLGGAVSLSLAKEKGTKAMILLNPLDSLKSLLGDCCPLSGWASGLNFGNHFDAREALAAFKGCLLQFSAQDDAIIYYKRQKQLFFEMSSVKKKRCSIFVRGSGGHNVDQWENTSFLKALNIYLQRIDL